MKIELNNRVALVLGGTTPIGAAICKQLAESGARVVTADQTDTTDFDACVKLIETTENSVGPIDIVVNSSATPAEPKPFHQMDKAQWDKAITGNIDVVFNICRNLAEKMSNRGFGRIINISSIISRMGQSGQTHEAAAMAGLHGFTMALAQELARKGVTVNTISAGYIASSTTTDQPLPANIPAGRAGNVNELASLVDYLCSDHAGYINGADIAINGGQYMH